MGKVRVRVKGQERTIRNIKRDLKRGMDKSAEKIAESGRDKALEIINRNQAYFNYEVAKGFRIIDGRDTQTRSSIKLINEAPHAGALDAGVPASEYADGGPPVQALLPWVARKMQGWNLDTDSDGGGAGSVFDVGPDVPRSLTGRYDSEDVEVGDDVYVKDSPDHDFLEQIVEKREYTFIGEDSFGNQTEWDYDQIISPLDEHPVLSTHGKPDTGDQVYWYNEDGDLLGGYVTGSNYSYDGYGRSYFVTEFDTDTEYEVPVTRFVDASERPEYDDSLATPSMKQVFIRDTAGGKAQMAYYGSDVVAYSEFTGETVRGTVTSPPVNLNDGFKVKLETGEEFDVDATNEWVLRHIEDFPQVPQTRQNELMLGHYDDIVAKTDGNGGTPSASDIQNLRDGVENFIFPSYRDREHLGRVIFEWEKARITQDRDHVGNENDGWRIQHSPGSGQRWDRVLSHEFGHTYSQPTDTRYTLFGNDPEEYNFAGPWSKRNDSSHSHMYDSGLPDWNPYDEENAVHTYVEAYMAVDDSSPNYVRYSNGNIVEDNRDQLEPYGFSDWEDEVEELARLEAEGTSPATEALKDHVQELTEQQVLKPDDMKLEQGDFIAVRENGEVKILEFTGWDGPNSPTTFMEGDEPDTPREGIAYGFKTPHEEYGSESFYVGEDGTLYVTETDEWNDYYLSKDNAPEFVGMVDKQFYDESLDEFPELTTPESEPKKRLQEAANMAWWYQVVHIANDQSPNKADSKEIVLSGGYSATTFEEVMATFGEAMTMPNPSRKKIKELKMLARTYPYFIEAYLLTKKPVSAEAEKVLRDEGFIQ